MTRSRTVRRLVSQREGFEGGPGSGPQGGKHESSGKVGKAHEKKSDAIKELHQRRAEGEEVKLYMERGTYTQPHGRGRGIETYQYYFVAPPGHATKKEAGKGMVDQRYDSSHPEGFVDHRYSDHKGNLGQKEARRKGWAAHQKDMHKRLGKQLARESRSGRPAGPIEVDSDPDHPIDMRSISSQSTRIEGWKGGFAYSPPVKKIREATTNPGPGVIIKEF